MALPVAHVAVRGVSGLPAAQSVPPRPRPSRASPSRRVARTRSRPRGMAPIRSQSRAGNGRFTKGSSSSSSGGSRNATCSKKAKALKKRAPAVAYTSASAMDRRRLTNAKSLDHTPVQKVGKSGLELRGLPEPRLHRSTFDRLRPIASRPQKSSTKSDRFSTRPGLPPPPSHGFRQ